MGLQVNIEKIKYMKSGRSSNRSNNIRIGDDEFDVVHNFVYLGSCVNNTNDITQEIKRRIMLANRTLYGLSRILRSKFVRRNTKVKIYKTLIIPVLMYGVESWVLTQADESMLGILERKVLRMIYGPTYDAGMLRIWYNHDFYQLYQDSNIVCKIRKRQIRWLGHVYRMQTDAPPKKIAFARNVGGQRRAGNPGTRWLIGLENELSRKNVRDWRSKAVNREEWRAVVDRFWFTDGSNNH